MCRANASPASPVRLPVTDFAATPKWFRTVPSNITELIRSSDKIRTMTLLNCDEKYRNGTASDYEWLAEWERILPLCPAYGAAELYRAEKEDLGLEGAASPRALWQKGRDAVQAWTPPPPACVDLTRIVSNFIRKAETLATGGSDETKANNEANKTIEKSEKSERESEPLSYRALSNSCIQAALAWSGKSIPLTFETVGTAFAKPNPYLAEQVWNGIRCDLQNGIQCVEKCNEEERFVLYAQLSIDCLLAARRQGRSVCLCLRGGTCAARRSEEAFLAYLAARRLLPEEVRIGTEGREDRRLTLDLCAAYGGVTAIAPAWILMPSDLGRSLPERIAAWAEEVPIGALRFGGIRTDSPLYPTAHRLFFAALETALASLCSQKEQADLLYRRFF